MRLGFGARPAGVACLLSWLASIGCNPGRIEASSRAGDGSDGATQATGTTSEGGVNGTPGSTTGDASSATDTLAPAAPPAADAITIVEPAPVEPCESHAGEGDCNAAGCIWFATERVADLSTCALEPAGFCAAASASTGDEDYDSAFYERIGDVVHLRRVGRKASEFPGPEHPAGWTECGRGGADPAECGCVCAGGHCPGDVALDLLEACGAPRACADLPAGDLSPDGEACFYKTLAARAAAALRLGALVGDRDIEDRVYLRGDGTATWIRSECDRRDASCSDRKWDLPRLCTLRAPADFTACAASEDPETQAKCRDVASWFSECKLAPATCP